MSVTIKMMGDEVVRVCKDGNEIMTFSAEENLGDIYYDIIGLLKALDIDIQEEWE